MKITVSTTASPAAALEALRGLQSELAGSGARLWRPNPDPVLAELEDALTAAGVAHLGRVLAFLLKALGAEPRPEWLAKALPEADFGGLEPLLKAALETPWGGWEEARAHFRSKNVTPEDLMRLARWVTTELVKGAGLKAAMQRVALQAFLYRRWLAQRQLPSALPRTLGDVPRIAPLGAREARSLAFVVEHALEEAAAFPERVRQALSRALLEAAANGEPLPALARRLRDAAAASFEEPPEDLLSVTFWTLNRDWRRLAVTEAARAANHGLLSSLKPGSRVRWNALPDACGYCKQYDGRVFTVVNADRRDKDGEVEVWAGKSNFGRSPARRKRVNGELLERPPEERYWPTQPAHPNCRCWWSVVEEPAPGREPQEPPDLEAFRLKLQQRMQALLAEARA